MAYKIGSQTVVDDSANVYAWTGPFGQYSDVSANLQPFFYKRIYTRGFVCAGYRSSTPWNNVNETDHSTDTTWIVPAMERAGAYCCGNWSAVKGYMYATSNSFPGNSSHVVRYYMYTHTTDSWGDVMSNSRDDCGTMQWDDVRGYVFGGSGDSIDNHQFASDSMSHLANGHNSDNHQNCNQWGDDIKGYKAHGSGKITYSSNSFGSFPNMIGSNTHDKSMATKMGYFYSENNGNGTTSGNVYKYNVTTESGTTTGSFKSHNAGETNFQTGQYHGYGMGDCGDSCQENTTYKSYYFTDSHVAGGGTMESKGTPGRSSGHCLSRED